VITLGGFRATIQATTTGAQSPERLSTWHLVVLSREVGHFNRWPASENRVTPVMVVGVEPAVKSPGALSV
jgi:hypothetical protein